MTTAEDMERLKGQVRDLERILVREGAVEASYERRLAEAVRERDEARAELVNTAQQLELEREHSARLSRECQERHDELRAEVERLKAMRLTTYETLREFDVYGTGGDESACAREVKQRLVEARAEVERLRASIENLDSLYVSRTDSLREYEAALRTAGIRLETLKHQLTEHQYQELASVLFDLPLVTEGEP